MAKNLISKSHVEDETMTPAMKRIRELRDRQSRERQRMAELSLVDELTPELRDELDQIERATPDVERQIRAAQIAADDEVVETRDLGPDTEMRERIELRSRASLTNYLVAAMAGRQVSGPEAELQSAAGIGAGIPLELWDVPQPALETRADAPTSAPGTTGINLDRIRPAVFANSIAPRLGIEMPRVESGSYASATINQSLTADSKGKGDAADSTAATFTVNTVTAKRISARLGIRIEDVASVGQANFESILRENLSLVLSDEMDSQAINGVFVNGTNNDLNGIFHALTDPTAAPSAVSDFDAFASAHASGIDGLWANTLKDVTIVCGPDTMKLSARTFQTATNYKGETSAAAYAMMNTAGWWTNKRMPDPATFLTVDEIQQALLYRKGRSMRTAVLPHWNEISIDDIYSGSAQGERFFTLHVLLGDVILVQPSAYTQIAFKVA